jgi:hypothetical protein
MKEAPEIQAARKLLASAAGGIPTLHAPINRVLAGLGLEVSRKETPAQKIARVRAAVARYDALRTPAGKPGASALRPGGAWLSGWSVVSVFSFRIRRWLGKQK